MLVSCCLWIFVCYFMCVHLLHFYMKMYDFSQKLNSIKIHWKSILPTEYRWIWVGAIWIYSQLLWNVNDFMNSRYIAISPDSKFDYIFFLPCFFLSIVRSFVLSFNFYLVPLMRNGIASLFEILVFYSSYHDEMWNSICCIASGFDVRFNEIPFENKLHCIHFWFFTRHKYKTKSITLLIRR